MFSSQSVFIETESVITALEAMRQAKPLGKTHPLTQFVSILPPYHNPIAVLGEGATEEKIFRTLAGMIQRRLNEHRQLHSLPPLSRKKKFISLGEDFRTQNDELEAWSVLYHRYVLIDFSLSPDQIANYSIQDKRTIHRRQRRGTLRLQHELLRREQRARTHLQQTLLQAQLPPRPSLVGRDNFLKTAYEILQIPAHWLIIHGPPGIGKTAFVTEIVHTLVENDQHREAKDQIENIAWIDHPQPGVEQLLEQIAAELSLPLNLERTRSSLNRYLSVVNSLIIIDQADNILNSSELVQLISTQFGRAHIIFCVRTLPVELDVATSIVNAVTIHLPELEKADALMLVESLAKHKEVLDHFDQIYAQVGGNPAALLSFVQRGGRLDSATDGSVYQSIWDRSTPLDRLIWVILALYTGKITTTILKEILVDFIYEEITVTLNNLQRQAVLEPGSHITVTVTALAKTFVFEQLRVDNALTPIAIQRIVEHQAISPTVSGCIQLLESLDRITISEEMRLELAYNLAPLVEHMGIWATWLIYLNRVQGTAGADVAWLALHQGIALRWLGKLPEAAHLLGQCIVQAGQVGAFIVQADALAELAAIYRFWRDNNTQASNNANNSDQRIVELLQRAYEAYTRYRLTPKMERVLADFIQLALDKGDLVTAQEYLNRIPQEFSQGPTTSGRLLSLAAALCLRLNQPEQAFSFAQEAVNAYRDDASNLGRVTALLGRIYYRLGNWRQAIDTLSWALRCMEQVQDVVGFTRCKLNLALVFLERGNLKIALNYLDGLPAQFEALGDAESLRLAVQYLEKITQARTGTS